MLSVGEQPLNNPVTFANATDTHTHTAGGGQRALLTVRCTLSRAIRANGTSPPKTLTDGSVQNFIAEKNQL